MIISWFRGSVVERRSLIVQLTVITVMIFIVIFDRIVIAILLIYRIVYRSRTVYDIS